MRVISFILLLVMLSGVCVAQSSRKKKKAIEQNRPAPNALNPGSEQTEYAPKKSKKKKSSGGPTYESEQQYYDRMARLVKEKKKAEKEMQKPQYSNPMYFGHKRPPKKNKRGKLKFCKECGIRH